MNVKSWGKTGLLACTSAALLAITACSSGAGTNVENEGAAQQNNTNNQGSGVITVSVVTSNRFLEQAKAKYEAANPGVKIELKQSYEPPKQQAGSATIGGFGYDPAAVEKHMATVNSELMNGNAADLIMVDTLAYSKYADKKLLADLQAYMNKEKGFNEEDYYMNIFDAMKYKDGLYAISPNVIANAWIGNMDRIKDLKLDPKSWTWAQFSEQLGELAKKGGDPILPYSPPGNLLNDRIGENLDKYLNWSDKKAGFDSPEFIALLNEIKSYYDNKIMVEPDPSTGGMGKAIRMGEKMNMKEAFLNMKLVSFSSLGFGNMAFENSKVFSPPTGDGSSGNSFAAGMLLAMNEKSKNKDQAWDFLKFLLSEEMQSLPDLGGLPVNKKAAEAQINALTSGENPLTQEQVDAAKEIMPKLSRFSGIEPKISDLVKAETEPFFKGEKSAEDVAKSLQNKVMLYMEE
ncbi:extracellular solute-binding protein [Paenibacillus pasadenensis]|uniref:ABC transporter substrate-binding protein n=1 Tax=Paenibacillus pasadenensis TaxID=217090 RepID=UPI00203D350B|nr:extracellular solute-binding protein [Paenibacillus pasadenensis]MCM3747036.1 extracellular solute-binding protein [Paenibacillus pasadenensis]